jgi:PGF-pre-PGF domain-containing protein
MRNNTASSGKYGLSLWNVENCTFTGNVMSGNWYNFDPDFDDIDSATSNIIDTTNLVDGKPIYYFEGETNPSIGSDAGAVYCINCGNTEIKDLVLQNNSCAIFLYNTSSEIQNNTINNTLDGVVVLSSKDVSLSYSRIENSRYGLGFKNDTNLTLTDNTVLNSTYGITTYNSVNCTLTGNSIKSTMENYELLSSGNSGLVGSEKKPRLKNTPLNSELVQSKGSGYGMGCDSCQDVKLENNNIEQVSIGIGLEECQNIELVKNSISDTGMGIFSTGSTRVEVLDNTVRNVTGEYKLLKSENFPLVGKSLEFGSGIFVISGEDLLLEGNTVEDAYQAWGIYLSEPVNATVKSNTLESCKIGFMSYNSYNCSVSDCSVTNCTSGGILITNSQEETGTESTVTGCTVDGSAIGLLLAEGGGIFTDNILSGNSYGLVLYDINNSLVYGNTMAENSRAGLAFDLDQTEMYSIIGLVGSMESPISGNNTIYNNYFNNVNNTLFYTATNNTWNTSKTSGESIVGGPYLGGNYWANPGGTGFSENCTDADKDGIADSPYEIKNGTFDYLPLKIIPTSTTKHKSSANYVPSGGSSGVTGIDSAQKRVVAGTQTSFNFNNPVSGILGISFTSRQYSGNVIVRIEVLDGGSSEDGLGGEIYQQMNILVGNERFESESNINGASLSFRVPKSWVEESNIEVSTITINRFYNNEWNALLTEMTGEDEEYYYFTAETPGFSRYAITGDILNTEIITPSKVEETGTVTGEEQTTAEQKSTPGFESAFAAFGTLVSVFFAKKSIRK